MPRLTASRHLVGVHVENLPDIAGEPSADGGLEGSDGRTLVTDGRHVDERVDDSARVRHWQVKDEVEGWAAEIVQLRLTYSWQHHQGEVNLEIVNVWLTYKWHWLSIDRRTKK